SLGTFVMSAHANGGHARHDAQSQQIERHVEDLLRTHVEAETANNMLRDNSISRMEKKQDWMLERNGLGMPPNVAKYEDVPTSERPGAIADPTLDLLNDPDAGHFAVDSPGNEP